MYESVNQTRLYEQVVEQIENRFFEGQLKSGDRLPPERELSELFGVSRTVIREAVKALVEKGLVEIRPGVGTFVRDSTSNIMRQSLGRLVMIDRSHGLENLTQVREIFEPEIAAIAATRAMASDVDALRQAVATMDESINDVTRYIQADHEFHLALARATQNMLIVELVGSIVDLLTAQRTLIFQAGTGGAEHGQYFHKQILKAVVDGDSAAARQIMLSHLQQVRTDSISVINQDQDKK